MANNIGDIWFEMNMGGNANKNAAELLKKMGDIVSCADAYAKALGDVPNVAKDAFTPFLKNYEKAAQMLQKVEDLLRSANSEANRMKSAGGNVKGIESDIKALVEARKLLQDTLNDKQGSSLNIYTDKLSSYEAKIKSIEARVKSIGKTMDTSFDGSILFRRMEGRSLDLDKMFGVADRIGAQSSVDKVLDSMQKLADLKKRLGAGIVSGDVNEIQQVAREYGILNEEIRNLSKSIQGMASAHKRAEAEQQKALSSQQREDNMLNRGKVQVESISNALYRLSRLQDALKQKGFSGGVGTVDYFSKQLGRLRIDLNNAVLSNDTSAIDRLIKQYQVMSKIIDGVVKKQKDMLGDASSTSKLKDAQEMLSLRMEGRSSSLKQLIRDKDFQTNFPAQLKQLNDIFARLSKLRGELGKAMSNGNVSGIKAQEQEYKALCSEIDNVKKKISELTEKQKLNREKGAIIAGSKTPLSLALPSTNGFDNIISRMDSLNNKTSLAKDLFNQLRSQMALTFMSVYGISAFVKKVITIGGEFERQHKALQVILGDMQQADALYGQLKNLAMDSPFTFKDLATYSKGLAAFSIPYKELFDTTNRLSDMSAGLGVDMNRLILAYGQVKSATVLRGQELRQFTEAGVPMVQKLADYFTRLNGKIVETSEVFDMISKKQVSFDAVKTVIEEMTNEGGEFYNMQGKIADTLSGRFTNMIDAWQIMLSEFADGKSAVGSMLKDIILLTTSVIRNINLVGAAIAGLGSAKLASMTNIGASFRLRNDDSYDYGTGYLKAKKLEAVAAQRRIINATLLAQEGALTEEQKKQLAADQALVATRNKMTAQDWSALAYSGQLSKFQIARLAREKKITQEVAKQLLINKGLTEAEANRTLNAGFFGRAANRIEGFGSQLKDAIKGIFNVQNMLFAGIGLAIAGVTYAIEDAAEKTRKAQQVIDEAESQQKELSKFLDDNNVEISSDPTEAKHAYDKFKEELYKHDPEADAFLVSLKVEYTDDLQKQAIAVRERLKQDLTVENIIGNLGEEGVKNVLESANGWLDDSYTTNVKQFVKKMNLIKGQIKDMSNDEISKQLNNALNAPGYSEESKKLAKEALNYAKATKDYKAAYMMWYNGSYKDKETIDVNEDAQLILEDLKKKFSNEVDANGNFTEMGKQAARKFMEGAADSEGLVGTEKEVFVNSVMDLIGQFDPSYVAERMKAVIKQSTPDLEQTALTDPQKAKQIIEANFNNYMTAFQLCYGLFNKDLQDYAKSHPMQIKQSLLVTFNITDEQRKKNELEELLRKKFGDRVYIAAKLETAADITEAVKKAQEYQKGLQEKIGTGKKIIAATVGLNFDISSGFDAAKKKLDNWIKSNQNNPFAFVVKQIMGWLGDVSDTQKGLKDLGVTPDTVKEPKSSGGNSNKKSGSGGSKEDKQLKAARKWLEEYRKFWSDLESKRELYGDSAFGMIKRSGLYKDLFNYVGADNAQDFNKSIDIIVKGLGKLSTEDRKAFARQGQEEKSRTATKAETKDISEYNQLAKKKIDILNEQYEIYKKLYQLTENEEASALFAGKGFGTETLLDYIRKELSSSVSKYNSKAGTAYSVDDILGMSDEEFNDTVGKNSYISSLRNSYLENDKKLKKEILDLTIEQLGKEFEIEDKIKKENIAYSERKTKLERQLKSASEKQRPIIQQAIDNNDREHYESLFKLNLDIQKRNIGWDKIFGDLGNASSDILKKVVDLIKNQLKDQNITPESAKALVEAMDKITNELINRNPFQTIIDSFKSDFGDVQKRRDLQEYLYNNYQKSYTFTDEQGAKYGLKGGAYTRQQLEDIAYNPNAEKLSKALSAVEKDFTTMHDILNPLLDMLDALGVDVGSIGDILSMPSNALNKASGTASSFSSLSKAFDGKKGFGGLGKFLGNAAPYAAAATMAFSVATSIFQLHDKALQKEIEASERREKEMTNLTNSLKNALENTLGGIYNTEATDKMLAKFDKYFPILGKGLLSQTLRIKYISDDTYGAMEEAKNTKSYFDASYASLKVQRDEIQHQMELEQDKKKKDSGKIEDYKAKLEELDTTIEHFARNMAKELYGIDAQDWAKQLSDSLVDAWANGEDAMLAYKRTLNDLIKSSTKSIVAKSIMENALKPLDDYISKEMTATDGKLTAESISNMVDLAMKGGESAYDAIFKFLDGLKQRGVDLSDTSSSSTIGKGIQSVTEDTADLLASYINAIRADVAINRQTLLKLSDDSIPSITSNLGLQLTELRNIVSSAERNAKAAEEIKSLLDSVITTGSGGKKVRV